MSSLRRMLSAAALTTTLSALSAAPALADTPLRTAVRADMPSLSEIYRDMHAHPELSGQEVQSAARMAGEARRAGFTVTENVGGHGVVAVMRNGAGPTVLIRADMDALPVTEQTNLPYASQVRVRTSSIPIYVFCSPEMKPALPRRLINMQLCVRRAKFSIPI